MCVQFCNKTITGLKILESLYNIKRKNDHKNKINMKIIEEINDGSNINGDSSCLILFVYLLDMLGNGVKLHIRCAFVYGTCS